MPIKIGPEHFKVVAYPFSLLLCSLAAGLIGRACNVLFHSIQNIFYKPYGGSAFSAAQNMQEPLFVAFLFFTGLAAALLWAIIFRQPTPPLSVAEMLENDSNNNSFTAAFHGFTQIFCVAFGASIGREAAPRIISASLSSSIGKLLKIGKEQRRILIACGAGAGLAAVYAVPCAGTIFTLEILLKRYSWRTVLPASITSFIATIVCQGFWFRKTPIYTIPTLNFSWPVTFWALVAAPILTVLGYLFRVLSIKCQLNRPRRKLMFITLPIAFMLVACCSVVIPFLVGNGEDAVHFIFSTSDLSFVAAITVTKIVVTLFTIRAGAWGGTLTPSIASGAGIGFLLSAAWSLIFPAVSPTAGACIGAAIFLGGSMLAPITSFALICELTHLSFSLAAPLFVATICGAIILHLFLRWNNKKHQYFS